MEQAYLVQVKLLSGKKIEKVFQTYREALCFATDYLHVKHSRIIRREVLLNEFNY